MSQESTAESQLSQNKRDWEDTIDDIDGIDSIDQDILEKFDGVDKRKQSIREDIYYGGPKSQLVVGTLKSVDTSLFKYDCLIHAFLTDVSLNFRKLTQDEKNRYADWFRRGYFASLFDPADEAAALAEVLAPSVFLREVHIQKLIDTFEINILAFEKTGSGVRVSGNLGGVDDLNEDWNAIVIYNPGDLHFRGVRDTSVKDGKYMFSYDEAVAILQKYGVGKDKSIPKECPYAEGEEVLHQGVLKKIVERVWESQGINKLTCIGVRFIKDGENIPLADIQKKPAKMPSPEPLPAKQVPALPQAKVPVPEPVPIPLPAKEVPPLLQAKPPVKIVKAPSTLPKPSSAAASSSAAAAAALPPPLPVKVMPELPAYPIGATREEILKQWNTETIPANRNVILRKMLEDRIFPESAETALEDGAGLYPDVKDPNFVKKIMEKREFAESKQRPIQEQIREGVNPCDPEQEFEISPVQRFVSRFLSPYTPFQSALLYHGVGVGKTCAAITIAEGYLERYPRDQVYIVAPPNIQPGFERTIFDMDGLKIGRGLGDSESESEMNTAKGCTGNTYLKLSGTLFEQDKKLIESRVRGLIRRRYKLMGYTQFANEIESVENRVGRRGATDLINEEIRKEYSGKVIIIDEAHNLRDIPDEGDEENLDAPGGYGELSDAAAGKKLTPFLRRLLTVAEGVTLVLLTGTPMYNSYSEIIFLLNLLLLNEKRASDLLTKDKIFDTNGDFKPGGRERIGAIAGNYVSFMRGENPLTFPIRLKPAPSDDLSMLTNWPNIAPNGKPIDAKVGEPSISEIQRANKFELPIVQCYFTGDNAVQYKAYTERTAALGLGIQNANSLVQAGNWIFPGDDDERIESRIRNEGFDNTFEARIESKQIVFRGRNGKPTWLAESLIGDVSPKTAILLKRLKTCQGCAFIYSRFVKSGALSIALALEANGYTPWGRDKGFLGDGIQAPGGLQCARCPRKKDEHNVPGIKHKFLPAKYVLLTGSEEYSPNNPGAIATERRIDNMFGEQIKVVVGSQVVSEGIDLRFIREIYVFDSWFHLNKLEQVIGRGIRTCSHALFEDKRLRNCTVYLLANAFEPEADGSTMETMDLYTYRRAIRKAVEVGRVTRVLKEYAVDCNLNHDAILVSGIMEKVPMIDGQGNPRDADLNDTPFTALCDWEECETYKCIPEVPVSLATASEKTYTEYAAKWQEQKLLDRVRKLFEGKAGKAPQAFVKIEDFRDYFEDISRKSLSILLQTITKSKSFYITLFGKRGKIIYKNGYFLFQPTELVDDTIPLALRIAPYPVKRDSYEPEKYTEVPLAPKPVMKVGGPGAAAPGLAPKKEEEPAVDKTEIVTDFWDAVVDWSNTIRGKTALEWTDVTTKKEKPEVNIPAEVAVALNVFHSRDEKLFRRSSERLGQVTWMYLSVKENDGWRNLLADILEEIIWDEFLSSTDQMILINEWKTSPADMEKYSHIYQEHWLTSGSTSAFRFVDNRTGTLRYICGDKECTEIQKSVLEESESNKLKSVTVNTTNTGYLYGFLVPKKGELIFKNVNPPSPGAKVEKGQECSISSQVSDHLRKLKELGATFRTEKGSDLDLNEEKLTGARKFENAVRACFLMDIVMRLMDKLVISKKRWMYKSISSKIAGHKGTFEKAAASGVNA